jgi:hypothetical protein
MKQKTKRNSSQKLMDKTLEQLDGKKWGEPTYDSYVVRTAHAVRRKPIGSLTDEELRLAIGQQVGLEWLVPLALERLSQDPFRSGDFYDGDLLANVARVPQGYWAEHSAERTLLQGITSRILHDERLSDLSNEAIQAVVALGTAE